MPCRSSMKRSAKPVAVGSAVEAGRHDQTVSITAWPERGRRPKHRRASSLFSLERAFPASHIADGFAQTPPLLRPLLHRATPERPRDFSHRTRRGNLEQSLHIRIYSFISHGAVSNVWLSNCTKRTNGKIPNRTSRLAGVELCHDPLGRRLRELCNL